MHTRQIQFKFAVGDGVQEKTRGTHMHREMMVLVAVYEQIQSGYSYSYRCRNWCGDVKSYDEPELELYVPDNPWRDEIVSTKPKA